MGMHENKGPTGKSGYRVEAQRTDSVSQVSAGPLLCLSNSSLALEIDFRSLLLPKLMKMEQLRPKEVRGTCIETEFTSI